MSSAAATPTQQARALVDALSLTLEEMSEIITHETALVRQGDLRQAETIEQAKSALAQRYYQGMEAFRANRDTLVSLVPAECERLRSQHEIFKSFLQTNMIVLATAQAVSEGILRSVSQDMARDDKPKTYGAYGQMTQPRRLESAPLLVSRVS